MKLIEWSLKFITHLIMIVIVLKMYPPMRVRHLSKSQIIFIFPLTNFHYRVLLEQDRLVNPFHRLQYAALDEV